MAVVLVWLAAASGRPARAAAPADLGAAAGTVYVATRGPDEVVALEPGGQEPRRIAALPGEPSALAVAPDGGRLYVGVPEGVAVVDALAGRVTQVIPLGAPPSALAVAPGGARVLAVWEDPGGEPDASGRLALVDGASGALRETVTVAGLPSSVAVTADGRRAVVGHRFYSGLVTIVNLAVPAVEGTLALEDGVAALAAAPDGRVFAANGVGSTGRVSAIDPRRRVIVAEREAGQDPTDVALAPDGARLWLADFRGGGVTALALPDLGVDASAAVGDYPLRLAVTPDGRSVVVLHNGERTLTRIVAATAVVEDPVTLAGEPLAIAAPAVAALAEEDRTDPSAGWAQVGPILGALAAAFVLGGAIGLLWARRRRRAS